MKKLTRSMTRFRRVSSSAAVLALASFMAAGCDPATGPEAIPGPGAVTGVEVVVTPSGAATTNLPRGITVQLLGAPHDANNAFVNSAVTWSTSSAAIATVNASGLVTTVGGGTATITATSAAGPSGSIELGIQHPVTAVTVESDTLEIRREGTANLTITLVDTQGDTVDGRNVQFITLDEDIASVTDDGVVQGVADGTATIQITSEGVTETIDIVVSGVPLVAAVVVDADVTFGGIGQSFTATHESEAPSGAEIPGTTAAWSSSATSVATVDAVTGLVTLVGEGTADIRATVDNGDGVDVVGSLTVRGAPVLVSGVGMPSGTIASGTPRYFALIVPAGVTNISVSTDAGTSGDGDLFLMKAGINPPTPAGGGPAGSALHCTTSGVCVSGASGNPEAISLSGGNLPPPGTYPISYHAWTGGGFTDDVTGVTITATIAP